MTIKEKAKRTKKLNACEWKKFIKEQQISGLSQQEYCNKKGISKISFKNWKYKINKQQQSDKLTFAPIKVLGSKVSSEMKIELPSGIKIIITKDSDEAILLKLINLLRVI